MFGRSFGVHWRLLAFCLALLQARAGVAMQGNPAALSPETAKIRDQVNDLPVGGKLTVRSMERNITEICRRSTERRFQSAKWI
ncbi:MAG TPA: hypothetical protein VHZ74_15250 [Bryobacteraceae bacterium]|jgi:hypothetical protein|nr:hypothetical protein [Bryobacteraceae bacterium]